MCKFGIPGKKEMDFLHEIPNLEFEKKKYENFLNFEKQLVLISTWRDNKWLSWHWNYNVMYNNVYKINGTEQPALNDCIQFLF